MFLIKIFPVSLSYLWCSLIVFIGSRLNWKRKKIAMKNLNIVFPEKTGKEKKVIFRESLKNMLKNYFEIGFIASKKYSEKNILNMVSAEGLEHLDKVIEQQRGALLYSGHFGNFPLMVLWLAIKGYPVAAIYKEAQNFSEDFFGNIMKDYNVTPLKYKLDHALTLAIIRALKEKKIVLIQNDQSHPGGIYINFFNKWVPAPAGPAILAKRTDSPVIPAYIIRDKNNHHTIKIFPEIILKEEENNEHSVKANTQILIDWIAEILKKHPTEWLWLHNRWKRAKEINK